MLPIPKLGTMGGCSSFIGVSLHSAQTNGQDMTHRVFPKNKVAGILKRQIARPVETFTDVATLSNLPTSFILLLLRSPHFTEANFDVCGELQSRSVEGTCFLFGKSRLELRVVVSSNMLGRLLVERLTNGNWSFCAGYACSTTS